LLSCTSYLPYTFITFPFHYSLLHRDLHSFPTRRSSDLQVITDTLLTVGETSGTVGKAEGNVSVAVIYCRLPQLGGFWSTLLAKTDRKSTRLNSSHRTISYAVFCLKKKKTSTIQKMSDL